MKRHIKKIAIIGSGIMGSGIACHFANIGVEVLLLDVIAKELTDEEKEKGETLESKKVRNRIVNENLNKTLHSNPSPIYDQKFASRIQTGNTIDNMHEIAQVDWIIEVVVENLNIKKKVFEQIDIFRKPGTLITSNTSGIPIRFMTEGRSDDFKTHFCGTHFFNPARYLKLFEIIPGPKTSPEVLNFLTHYGSVFLGKTVVIAKDTPAFIGNRIGIFSIQSLFELTKKMDLSVEEIDKLTGSIIGRPKSATFRTIDVVGLDTLAKVADGIFENCKDDEQNSLFKTPSFITEMLKNKMLGNKTGQGFYKKEGTEILSLDLKTLSYKTYKNVYFETLAQAKTIEDPLKRFNFLITGKDKAGDFYRKSFAQLFAYISNRIPEISSEIYQIDLAMKAGFGWENGPFEIWDAIGIQKGIELIQSEGLTIPNWVAEMAKSHNSFYTNKNGTAYFYDIISKNHIKIPGQETFIILNHLNKSETIWSNNDSLIQHLGKGILNIAFKSKMNTIGSDVLFGINKAIDLCEKDYLGLVIGNQSANFSAGANLAMIFMLAKEQEYEELNIAIKYFQDTLMRIRYSSIPVIVAPHGITFGGGCEMSLHADKVIIAAETYIGLVEFGVGLIPGGGGSKEMTLRASDLYKKESLELNILKQHFLTIASAKVSGSAYEAYDNGILQKNKDIVVVNKDRQIAEAKKHALILSETGYTAPIRKNDIKVLGKQALSMFLAGTDQMFAGNYISEHDKKIANKLGYVMSGGDLSDSNLVSEQYLLDLERETFLSLCAEPKTLQRIQFMLKNGKPLRN